MNRIIGCVAIGNGRDGFSVDNAVISGCHSEGNGGAGYRVGKDAVIENSVAINNQEAGFAAADLVTVKAHEASSRRSVGRYLTDVSGNALAGLLAAAAFRGLGG